MIKSSFFHPILLEAIKGNTATKTCIYTYKVSAYSGTGDNVGTCLSIVLKSLKIYFNLTLNVTWSNLVLPSSC